MRILVCPLDWGLGHATRCVPLIRALRERHEVVIGAGGLGRRFLAREFPDLEAFDFPGYRVRYSRRAAFFLPMMVLQMPMLFAGMAWERRRLSREIARRRIDAVISDGRYGCHSDRVPSVLVTHQIFIRIPGDKRVEETIFAWNRRLLGRFAEVWVPDFPGTPNLSGDLAHGAHGLPKVHYLGPLSRFPSPPAAVGAGAEEAKRRIKVLASVSGPEPQRTLFEEALRRELEALPGTRVLLRGLPGASQDPAGAESIREGELNVLDHLDGAPLERLLQSAELVVSRSGYTTVMEMASLGLARIAFSPTPGQSEQEYLAAHLESAGVAPRLDQDRLDLESALRPDARFSGFAAFPRGESGLREFLAGHPVLGAR